MKPKAKPFPPCTQCDFNDHRPDDCRMFLECEICGSNDHVTSGNNRVIYIREAYLLNPLSLRHIRESIWYLDSRCSRSMTGVKSYLHKYVEQPGPKVVFGDNSSCITEGYVSINCGGIVFLKLAFMNDLKYKLISISQICDAKYIVQFDDKPVSPMSINYEKYTLVIVDEYSRYTLVHFLKKKSHADETIMYFIRMVDNHNDIKVKQIRTDNGTEFRNQELKNFCDEKGISKNFSSPYTPEQNGVAERNNRTLIEAARKMMNGSVLSKHFWTKAVRIACYTQNRSIIVKRHDKTHYEISRERIPDISYFHVFGCPMFIHNHKDYLGKFDAKADDGYFLGCSFVSIAFRVFNTRRQQVEETYHITFDESMEAIRFTNTSVDEIGIDDSSRYSLNEYLYEDDPSRQYQTNYDISFYITPHNHSLIELTTTNHVPEVIVLNEQNTPHTEETIGPPDLINTEGTNDQTVQTEQIDTQNTKVHLGGNTKVAVPTIEFLVPEMTLSPITHHASTSSIHVP
ncbi:retrovirus-related pol polyprotein from transposon TNT 1-94 [Tanacetum coccineum]